MKMNLYAEHNFERRLIMTQGLNVTRKWPIRRKPNASREFGEPFLLRSTPPTLFSRPNDRNLPTQMISQHCWAQHVVATVLRCVATCWVLLARIRPFSNLSQQHPTSRNTVAKRTQHVAPNHVKICCVGMLRWFGRGLIHDRIVCCA